MKFVLLFLLCLACGTLAAKPLPGKFPNGALRILNWKEALPKNTVNMNDVSSEFGNFFQGTVGMDFGPDDAMYGASTGSGPYVYRITKDGRLTIFSSVPGELFNTTIGTTSLAGEGQWGPNDHFYFSFTRYDFSPTTTTGSIPLDVGWFRMNQHGTIIKIFPTAEQVGWDKTDLFVPTGSVIKQDGTVYIADCQLYQILKLTPNSFDMDGMPLAYDASYFRKEPLPPPAIPETSVSGMDLWKFYAYYPGPPFGFIPQGANTMRMASNESTIYISAISSASVWAMHLDNNGDFSNEHVIANISSGVRNLIEAIELLEDQDVLLMATTYTRLTADDVFFPNSTYRLANRIFAIDISPAAVAQGLPVIWDEDNPDADPRVKILLNETPEMNDGFMEVMSVPRGGGQIFSNTWDFGCFNPTGPPPLTPTGTCTGGGIQKSHLPPRIFK